MLTRDAVGRRVRHAVHGAGVVVSLQRGGREAAVRFDGSGLPRSVPARTLTLEAVASPAPHAPAPPPSPAVEPAPTPLGPALDGSYDAHAASLTLEAMRLGVVPVAALDAYTVGRDAELALVEADLGQVARAGGAVRAFVADYGVGKTHLLELTAQHALARNHLTAHVVLDPRETPPSHPKRVYRALVRSLRYPDRPFEEGAGLEPLLAAAARSDAARAAVGAGTRADITTGLHLYLAPALEVMGLLEGDPAAVRTRGVAADQLHTFLHGARDLLLAWIEGHPTIPNAEIDAELRRLGGRHRRIYSLQDVRPWARIYGYLLSGLAHLARASGYAGLTVLVDEAEFYALLSKENRDFARQLFQALAYAAVGGDPAGLDASELPFEADALDGGGQGILRELPGRFGDAPGLYVVFAMTPHPDGLAALGGAVPADRMTSLAALGGADYARLTERVCDFYASANPDFELPGRIVAPLAKTVQGLVGHGLVTNPRQAMKFLIELLDVVRYHRDRVPTVLRQLAEQLAF